MLTSLFMAFSLYSRIPVPHVEWDEKNMRYCICFLPAVGAAIGLAQAGLFLLLTAADFGPAFRGAFLCVCPVLLSGGIHLDGFLDTCDAIHSYGSREKKLEILKDPHVGAFAVIGGIVYFILYFGIWSQAGSRETGALCMTFVLSRALSAFAAVTFPKAKKDGMLQEETRPAARGTSAAMVVTAFAAAVIMVCLDPLPGAAGLAAAVLTLLYYHHMAVSTFGGTTGDLSGWFTQTSELMSAGAIVIAAALLH